MEKLKGTDHINWEQHIADWHMFAPVDWRWDLARQIANGEVSDPGEMSCELTSAVDYQRRRKAGGALTTETDQHITAALELHQQDTPLRWEVEARLLAGETDSFISEKTGVRETTIATYEPLFYEVRNHRRATDYLLGATTDFAHLRGFRNDELRQFWSWCALAGGPIIVDQMVDIFHKVRRKGEPPCLAIYLRWGALDLLIQVFIALQVIPPKAHALWFFNLSTKLQVAQHSVRPVADTNRIYRALVRCARHVLETGEVPSPPDWWSPATTPTTESRTKARPTDKSKGKQPLATSCKKERQEEEPIGS